MTLPTTINVNTFEYSGDTINPVEVSVSAEYPVLLKINGNALVSIICSGSDMEYLALGHLLSEGIINSYDEMRRIDIDENTLEINVHLDMNDDTIERLFKVRSIVSGCGQGRTSIHESTAIDNNKIPEVKGSTITLCMKEFLHSSEIHSLTHGVHSSALYSIDGDEIVFFDEIGRHNAIDKVIGFAAKEEISLSSKMILSTGRLASEIVYKTIHSSIPIIASKASPTSLSIELAQKYNLVLIGRVRGNKFCIFNGRDKIIC